MTVKSFKQMLIITFIVFTGIVLSYGKFGMFLGEIRKSVGDTYNLQIYQKKRSSISNMKIGQLERFLSYYNIGSEEGLNDFIDLYILLANRYEATNEINNEIYTNEDFLNLYAKDYQLNKFTDKVENIFFFLELDQTNKGLLYTTNDKIYQEFLEVYTDDIEFHNAVDEYLLFNPDKIIRLDNISNVNISLISEITQKINFYEKVYNNLNNKTNGYISNLSEVYINDKNLFNNQENDQIRATFWVISYLISELNETTNQLFYNSLSEKLYASIKKMNTDYIDEYFAVNSELYTMDSNNPIINNDRAFLDFNLLSPPQEEYSTEFILKCEKILRAGCSDYLDIDNKNIVEEYCAFFNASDIQKSDIHGSPDALPNSLNLFLIEKDLFTFSNELESLITNLSVPSVNNFCKEIKNMLINISNDSIYVLNKDILSNIILLLSDKTTCNFQKNNNEIINETFAVIHNNYFSEKNTGKNYTQYSSDIYYKFAVECSSNVNYFISNNICIYDAIINLKLSSNEILSNCDRNYFYRFFNIWPVYGKLNAPEYKTINQFDLRHFNINLINQENASNLISSGSSNSIAWKLSSIYYTALINAADIALNINYYADITNKKSLEYAINTNNDDYALYYYDLIYKLYNTGLCYGSDFNDVLLAPLKFDLPETNNPNDEKDYDVMVKIIDDFHLKYGVLSVNYTKEKQSENMLKLISYIPRHIKNGVFQAHDFWADICKYFIALDYEEIEINDEDGLISFVTYLEDLKYMNNYLKVNTESLAYSSEIYAVVNRVRNTLLLSGININQPKSNITREININTNSKSTYTTNEYQITINSTDTLYSLFTDTLRECVGYDNNEALKTIFKLYNDVIICNSYLAQNSNDIFDLYNKCSNVSSFDEYDSNMLFNLCFVLDETDAIDFAEKLGKLYHFIMNCYYKNTDTAFNILNEIDSTHINNASDENLKYFFQSLNGLLVDNNTNGTNKSNYTHIFEVLENYITNNTINNSSRLYECGAESVFIDEYALNTLTNLDIIHAPDYLINNSIYCSNIQFISDFPQYRLIKAMNEIALIDISNVSNILIEFLEIAKKYLLDVDNLDNINLTYYEVEELVEERIDNDFNLLIEKFDTRLDELDNGEGDNRINRVKFRESVSDYLRIYLSTMEDSGNTMMELKIISRVFNEAFNYWEVRDMIGIMESEIAEKPLEDNLFLWLYLFGKDLTEIVTIDQFINKEYYYECLPYLNPEFYSNITNVTENYYGNLDLEWKNKKDDYYENNYMYAGNLLVNISTQLGFKTIKSDFNLINNDINISNAQDILLQPEPESDEEGDIELNFFISEKFFGDEEVNNDNTNKIQHEKTYKNDTKIIEIINYSDYCLLKNKMSQPTNGNLIHITSPCLIDDNGIIGVIITSEGIYLRRLRKIPGAVSNELYQYFLYCEDIPEIGNSGGILIVNGLKYEIESEKEWKTIDEETCMSIQNVHESFDDIMLVTSNPEEKHLDTNTIFYADNIFNGLVIFTNSYIFDNSDVYVIGNGYDFTNSLEYYEANDWMINIKNDKQKYTFERFENPITVINMNSVITNNSSGDLRIEIIQRMYDTGEISSDEIYNYYDYDFLTDDVLRKSNIIHISNELME